METGRYGLGHAKDFDSLTKEELLRRLITPSSERHFLMYEALRKGASVEQIYEITKIKAYFIEQMKELVEEEEKILKYQGRMPEDDVLIAAKKDGFSDKYLSRILQIPEEDIRRRRLELGAEETWEESMSAEQRTALIIILLITERRSRFAPMGITGRIKRS